MKNDRGFTLIELIVVMVIMAIMAVGGVSGYNLLNTGDAKNAAKRILITLDYVQTENMTKSKTYTMKIVTDATGDFYLKVFKDTIEESSEKFKLKNGQIAFQYYGDSVQYPVSLSSSEKLEISFKKDTGGVKANLLNTISRIRVTSSGTSCYIRLVTMTGKHFIE